MFDHDDETDGETCPQCGGHVFVELGVLGKTRHIRCRACGADTTTEEDEL